MDKITGSISVQSGVEGTLVIPEEVRGADGYSPAASVTKNGSITTITITDKNGTTTAQVFDGADGQDYVLTQEDKEEIAGMVDAPVQDVQVNGTSILQDGVANVPVADSNTPGVVTVDGSYGIQRESSGLLKIKCAGIARTKAGSNAYEPIVASHQHESAFYGLAKAAGADMASISRATVGVYPEAQKSAIHEMLNGSVAVTGTTPAITALPGIRYVCGEVATLDITLPASGIVDVVFESGSTATVLTITPPTGVTVKWTNGFDPTVLEANTTYEINIADGLGVAASWT